MVRLGYGALLLIALWHMINHQSFASVARRKDVCFLVQVLASSAHCGTQIGGGVLCALPTRAVMVVLEPPSSRSKGVSSTWCQTRSAQRNAAATGVTYPAGKAVCAFTTKVATTLDLDSSQNLLELPNVTYQGNTPQPRGLTLPGPRTRRDHKLIDSLRENKACHIRAISNRLFHPASWVLSSE